MPASDSNVRPFALAGLPRVKGGDLQASRRGAVRFGIVPRRAELTVARFGRVSLTFAGVMHATRPAADESVWRLRRPGAAPSEPSMGSPVDSPVESRGWLVIGHAAALRLVSAILGIPGARVHRALGTTERGVLAAAISAVIRHAPGLALAGARPDEWSGSGLARIEAWAESETFRETFFLDVPPSWIPGSEPAASLDSLPARLPFSLIIELARTTITAEEWSRARPGDAIVFDETAASTSRAEARPVRVRCGDFAAPATFVASAGLRLTGGFAPLAPSERNSMANDPDRDITTTVLAAAPIEIVAELGRVTLRADEVAAMKGGAVVALPPKAEARIELRIGERLWARGELVDVDGQLGVRLISVAATPGRGDTTDADTLR